MLTTLRFFLLQVSKNWKELAIHIPFGQKIIDYALNDWHLGHANLKKEGKKSDYHYKDSVYEKLKIK